MASGGNNLNILAGLKLVMNEKSLQSQLAQIRKTIENKLKINVTLSIKGVEEYKKKIKEANTALNNNSSGSKNTGANSEHAMYIKLWQAQEKAEQRRRQAEENQRKAIASANVEREKALQVEQRIRTAIEQQNQRLRQQNIEQRTRTTSSLNAQRIREENAVGNFNVSTERLQGRINQLSSGRYANTVDVQALSALQNRLNQLTSTFQRFGTATPQYRQELARIGNSFRTIAQNASDAGRASYNLGDLILRAGRSMAIWLGVGNIFFGAIRGMKDMVNIIKEVDAELININKVLNLTNQEMTALTANATNVAIQFGKTTIEVLKAEAAFAKAGLGKEGAENLAKLALLLSNVGDLTIEQAQETLIASNAGYQLGNSYKDLLGIIDKFNEVDVCLLIQ